MADLAGGRITVGRAYDPARSGTYRVLVDELVEAAPRFGRENDFVAAQLARAVGRSHGDRALLQESVRLWDAVGAKYELASTLLLLADREEEGRRRLADLGCPVPALA